MQVPFLPLYSYQLANAPPPGESITAPGAPSLFHLSEEDGAPGGARALARRPYGLTRPVAAPTSDSRVSGAAIFVVAALAARWRSPARQSAPTAKPCYQDLPFRG